MPEISVTDAREQLGDLVNRAAYDDERIVLTRHGRAVAALVPLGVLRDPEEAEDAADLQGDSQIDPTVRRGSSRRSPTSVLIRDQWVR